MGLFGGLFKGIGNLLGGSPGGYSGEYKGQVDQTLGDYRDALDQSTGEDAYRRGVSSFGESFDRNIANQDAAGYGSLRRGGFRDDTGGRGLFGITRALGMAHEGVGLRNTLNQQRLSGLSGLAQMLQGLSQRFYKAPTQGLGGLVGTIAGSAIGGGLPGVGGTTATGTLPYQTDPWQGMGVQ